MVTNIFGPAKFLLGWPRKSNYKNILLHCSDHQKKTWKCHHLLIFCNFQHVVSFFKALAKVNPDII